MDSLDELIKEMTRVLAHITKFNEDYYDANTADIERFKSNENEPQTEEIE